MQHFKRETLTPEERESNRYLYRIVGIARHTESREPLMIYEALYDEGGLFARPLEMFLSEVDHQKYPEIQQQYRFESANKKVLES